MPTDTPAALQGSAHPEALARALRYFETLQPDDLPRLAEVFAPEARFKDPFNEVQGIPAIERVFRHMYERLDGPRFVITQVVAQGHEAFLAWDFHFAFRSHARGQPQCIRGATLWRFDAQGRIVLHRDYWDAAEELYEKLPGVGALMRWLKRRASS